MAMIRNLFPSDNSAGLFQPDIVLGAQFYATFNGSPRQPEFRLLAAVLEDAISCLSIKRPATARQRKQLEDARHWFAAEDNSEWIFSFKNICEALGINPAYLRRGLIRWVAATETSPAGGLRIDRDRRRAAGTKSGSEPVRDLPESFI